MKKYTYTKPTMSITNFSKENVITASSGTKEWLPSLEAYSVKAQVSFNDLVTFNK